jgi:hypothetical protein
MKTPQKNKQYRITELSFKKVNVVRVIRIEKLTTKTLVLVQNTEGRFAFTAPYYVFVHEYSWEKI